MNICIYGAASDKINQDYIAAGETLGEKMAENGIGLVFGAGAHGMMGAIARGVKRKHGKVIGVVPTFFNVDGILFDECDEMVRTETMRERKKILEERADGYLVTPGGIGTLDEFFEVFTLKQLARLDKPIVILNLNGFYDSLLNMLDGLVKEKTLTANSIDLFFVTDNPDTAIEYIKNYSAQGINPSAYRNIFKGYK